MVLVRVLLRNQILGCGNEVVKNVLLLVQHSGAVPVLAKFRTPAQIGDCEHATCPQPQIATANKLRRHTQVETAISSQQCGIFSVELQALSVKNKHGHTSAI